MMGCPMIHVRHLQFFHIQNHDVVRRNTFQCDSDPSIDEIITQMNFAAKRQVQYWKSNNERVPSGGIFLDGFRASLLH